LKLPQRNINESFEIYQDEPEAPPTPVSTTSRNGERIADEFVDDPEFQVV
jgi:hypothetical protein